jgi:hypothetical protein
MDALKLIITQALRYNSCFNFGAIIPLSTIITLMRRVIVDLLE